MLMPPDGRYEWLMNWINKNGHVDTLDSEFVDAYAEATGARLRLTAWGANKCPQLGRDLARMARCGYLCRRTVSLGGNWQPGFPRWIWQYAARNGE